MSSVPSLAVSRRNRRTPYTERVEALGVQGYSIVIVDPIGNRTTCAILQAQPT